MDGLVIMLAGPECLFVGATYLLVGVCLESSLSQLSADTRLLHTSEYVVSLARSIASSSSLNELMTTNGPNTSSR